MARFYLCSDFGRRPLACTALAGGMATIRVRPNDLPTMEPNPPAPPAPPAPPPPPRPAATGMSVAECAAQLKERFPALFGGAVKPLKLRIQADIQERAPG